MIMQMFCINLHNDYANGGAGTRQFGAIGGSLRGLCKTRLHLCNFMQIYAKLCIFMQKSYAKSCSLARAAAARRRAARHSPPRRAVTVDSAQAHCQCQPCVQVSRLEVLRSESVTACRAASRWPGPSRPRRAGYGARIHKH